MAFSEAVRSCLSKYATFSGRAPRSEYWYWTLFYLLILVGGGLLVVVLGVTFNGQPGIPAAIFVISLFALFLPMLAVSVRRFHDLDRSGWWFLMYFVPYIGNIIALIWFMFRGTAGDNRFGPDPLGGYADPGDGEYAQKSSIPTVTRKD